MKTYDLYGFKDADLEAVQAVVERALTIKFNLHESSYLGGEYYRFGNIGEEEFILQRNFNSFEQEWTEAEFKEISVLLYVNATKYSEEIERKLTSHIRGISLLKRESL